MCVCGGGGGGREVGHIIRISQLCYLFPPQKLIYYIS